MTTLGSLSHSSSFTGCTPPRPSYFSHLDGLSTQPFPFGVVSQASLSNPKHCEPPDPSTLTPCSPHLPFRQQGATQPVLSYALVHPELPFA
ncbi:hypothetical protein PMAYCL1PPCAC_32978 [Pristionchus mayeri]|uniref:Uncharacterized protein n=1 Tax=Pristionchus mayeri TaxID=1317129 RepID=A0AAN5DGE9_9BILA|nr:hypothetical protein PMAYCL1PPCAC_32978 [Pristionchus mayeri]